MDGELVDSPGQASLTPDTRPARWELRLSSYSGLVAWASHWHAELSTTRRDLKLAWRLDNAGARALSEPDYQWKPGDYSNRFLSRDDAQAAALAVFDAQCSPGDVLLKTHGSIPGDLDDVLSAPPEVLARLSGFTSDAEWSRWYEAFEAWEYATTYGYNAPPDPRSDEEIILLRVDGLWVIEPTKERPADHV